MKTFGDIPAVPSIAAHNGNGNGNNGNGHSGDSSAMSVDNDITTRIRAVFDVLSHDLAMCVGVDTRDGVVTLTRLVESRTQTEVAVAIAALVPGVRYVNDHLVADPRPPPRDTGSSARSIQGPGKSERDHRHH